MGGRGPWTLRGGPLNDSGGGGDFESEDKYAVCFLDFFDKNDNNNTVEKHLFFLIQSILLFHDRCCFTFIFSSSYICTITMTKIHLENIYFSYSKYIIFSNKF